MKRALLFILILMLALVFSCTKNLIDIPTPPANNGEQIVTPTGTAIGDLVTKKIGKDGGTLVSADGNAELIFPVDALDKDTEIGIQAITNNIPNGVNNSYRFSPDGIKFSKPVILKFHYSAENLSATLPDLMGIGFQDSVGAWWRVNNFTNDQATKTISAPIKHFSNWAQFDMMFIEPPTASLKVNQTINLSVDIVGSDDDLLVNLGEQDEIAPLYKLSAAKITWSANGVENGNSSFGTLTSGSISVATYKAPAKAPSQNPVAVSALVDVKFKYHGKSFDKTTLISNISITGEKYLLEIVERRDDLQLGIWVTDSASMDVDLGGDVAVITNIKNFAPFVGNPANVTTNGCTFSYIPDNIGEINITEAHGEMRVQSATQRAVQIFFTHSSTVDYSYRQNCLPSFDLVMPNKSSSGKPVSLFFNLTDSVVHDDDQPLPSVIRQAKLTLKKE